MNLKKQVLYSECKKNVKSNFPLYKDDVNSVEIYESMQNKTKQSILKFENVFFIRDDQIILNNINFEMFEKQNWAILGPNGSGKSVLFSMLFAYNLPTKGKIKVFGQEFGKTNWQKIKHKMRIVSSVLNRFESVLNQMTVYEILISGLKDTFGLYETITELENSKAISILQKYQFIYKRDTCYKNLSAGEKKKTLILRALIVEPEILILDEPCSSLDIFQREQILQTLDLIEDINLVYITHDINEILAKYNYIMLLKEGKIFAQGKRTEILTDEKISQLYNLKLRIKQDFARPNWQVINNG